MTDQHSGDTKISMDSELGRMVIEQKLATPDEVKECLDIHVKQDDANQHSLAEILVDKGVVTSGQIQRAKKTIEASRQASRYPR